MTFLLAIGSGFLYSEFLGYWLHRLLHSERIAWLSRSHMVHHLRDYGPRMPMRPSGSYKTATDGRTGIAGIGLEWLLPLALALAFTHGLLYLAEVALLPQLLFAVSAIAWGIFMFSYMHDSMHCQLFWMEGNSWLKGWYRKARRLHDIHHIFLHPSGRMHRNYGICFFAFDRIFGTLARKADRPAEETIERTLQRYASALQSPGPG